MNEAQNPTESAPELDAAEVAAYLVAHPEFARAHPEAFEAQHIGHDSQGAASLIERQVAVLRHTNRELAERFENLAATARANESRVVELNRVARIMVAATDVDTLIHTLSACLREHFAVDQVYVGLDGTLAEGQTAIDTLTPDGAASRALMHVYRRGKPLCGEISAAQAEALFDTGDEALLTSAAFIPLGHTEVRGAIVLAAAAPGRFTPDMGTLFVELFGRLLGATLARLLDAKALS